MHQAVRAVRRVRRRNGVAHKVRAEKARGVQCNAQKRNPRGVAMRRRRSEIAQQAVVRVGWQQCSVRVAVCGRQR